MPSILFFNSDSGILLRMTEVFPFHDRGVELRTRMLTVRPLVLEFFQESANAEWLKRFAGECGVSEVLLRDPHAWIPEALYYGILDRIQEVIPNPADAVRLAVHKSFTQETLGTFYTLARAFGTPRMAYQYYSHYLNRMQAIGRYELLRIDYSSASIRYVRSRQTFCEEVDCAYRMGSLEAIPTVFGFPLARVEKVACVCDGDPDCVYEISWTLPRKEIGWPVLGAVVLAGGVVVGVLPFVGTPTSVGVYTVVSIPIAISCWLFGLQKKWRRSLEETNQLVAEQRNSMQKELGTLWEKHEEAIRRAREEERIRRIFQKYVPLPVVESVLEQEGRIRSQGTNVNATILFSDLVGFTAYAESSAPAEILMTINTYLGRFSEVVSAYGGVVDKFIGDAVMALFGAIEPVEHHARQAVKTAIGMLDALDEINRKTGHEFQLRIGINTGPMVAGHVGSRERVAFTVMGDTVNLAQRIESAASPGTVFVSEAVRDACGDAFKFEFQHDTVVRGRTTSTRMYRLVRS